MLVKRFCPCSDTLAFISCEAFCPQSDSSWNPGICGTAAIVLSIVVSQGEDTLCLLPVIDFVNSLATSSTSFVGFLLTKEARNIKNGPNHDINTGSTAR